MLEWLASKISSSATLGEEKCARAITDGLHTNHLLNSILQAYGCLHTQVISHRQAVYLIDMVSFQSKCASLLMKHGPRVLHLFLNLSEACLEGGLLFFRWGLVPKEVDSRTNSKLGPLAFGMPGESSA